MFLHIPQPRENSSPVGGCCVFKGHSASSSWMHLGPTGHFGSKCLGSVIKRWKSLWQPEQKCVEPKLQNTLAFIENPLPKINRHRAAKSAFIFQELGSMSATNGGGSDVRATSTNQFIRVVIWSFKSLEIIFVRKKGPTSWHRLSPPKYALWHLAHRTYTYRSIAKAMGSL